jgi:hypothetical protein
MRLEELLRTQFTASTPRRRESLSRERSSFALRMITDAVKHSAMAPL